MSQDSPLSILYSSDGYELATKDGVALVVNRAGVLSMGSDGTNTRVITLDASGREVVVGAGTAGSAAGGVLTIQGAVAGTPIPVSGTVTAANASVSATGSAVPASATMVGGSDGTNLKSIRVAADGTVRIDPTGTTTQPVSGTVTANVGTTNGLALDATLTGGTAQVRITNGTNPAAILNAAPTTEYGIVTRNIPSGTQNVTGTGTAGTPATGVITIQGISGGTVIPVSQVKSTTSTASNVASSATNVTLLALNANRLGATIFNDSNAILYLKLGATASATSFTTKLYANAYYEVPFDYTGVINGIWANANGSARVDELTA